MLTGLDFPQFALRLTAPLAEVGSTMWGHSLNRFNRSLEHFPSLGGPARPGLGMAALGPLT